MKLPSSATGAAGTLQISCMSLGISRWSPLHDGLEDGAGIVRRAVGHDAPGDQLPRHRQGALVVGGEDVGLEPRPSCVP